MEQSDEISISISEEEMKRDAENERNFASKKPKDDQPKGDDQNTET